MDITELKARLEKLHGSSFGWALACCGRDRVEAEEVLQLVYLKILEGKARFRGEASLKTWLFAVIRKTAASERRRNLLGKLRFSNTAEVVQTPTSSDDPWLEFERSETEVRFRRALKALPSRQREILYLVFYHDLSLREAAEVMGISIGSARQHYDRGKKRLRETLERTEGNYGLCWGRSENSDAIS